MMRVNGLEKEMMLTCGDGRRRTAEENMDEGDAGGNGDEPGGTERSVEEKKLMEDADYMTVAKIHRINSTRCYMITGINYFSQILSIFLVIFSAIALTVLSLL